MYSVYKCNLCGFESYLKPVTKIRYLKKNLLITVVKS